MRARNGGAIWGAVRKAVWYLIDSKKCFGIIRAALSPLKSVYDFRHSPKAPATIYGFQPPNPTQRKPGARSAQFAFSGLSLLQRALDQNLAGHRSVRWFEDYPFSSVVPFPKHVLGSREFSRDRLCSAQRVRISKFEGSTVRCGSVVGNSAASCHTERHEVCCTALLVHLTTSNDLKGESCQLPR